MRVEELRTAFEMSLEVPGLYTSATRHVAVVASPVRQVVDDVERLMHPGEDLDVAGLFEVSTAWLAERTDLKEGTRKNYARTLSRFIKWAGGEGLA